jgi:hypothetical protein
MLRRDVIDACAQGKFAVYPVATIDEGITILTGRVAGRPGDDGIFAVDSVNGLIEARLKAFAGVLKEARLSHDSGPT